jgi:hypothetical protein
MLGSLGTSTTRLWVGPLQSIAVGPVQTSKPRLPFLKQGAAETAHRVVHQVAKRAAVMVADRALLRRAVLWASAN